MNEGNLTLPLRVWCVRKPIWRHRVSSGHGVGGRGVGGRGVAGHGGSRWVVVGRGGSRWANKQGTGSLGVPAADGAGRGGG